MYFWINFLLWNLGIFWYGLFFTLGLEPRWQKIPRWALAVGFALLALPTAYLKLSHPLSQALYWAAFVQLLLYVLVVFRERLWKKVLLFLLFIAGTEVSEASLFFIRNTLHIPFDATFGSLQMTLLVAAETSVIFISLSFLLIVWNRFITHRVISRRAYIFLVFPVSQVLMLFAFEGSFTQTPTISSNLFVSIGALLGLIADFILLYILMEQSQKEALAKSLHELEALHRVEAVHYQAIETRREEMAKIRHDFNNQLTTAYHLIEQGEPEHARALLDALRSDIAGTKEYAYCGNAVVNAVLNEKVSACQAGGIRLETKLELGEERNIKPIHMCSIFSNLLDNAIHAAAACPESQRFITVKAARKEDYLNIKVENSSTQPGKTNSERKAYGQEILRDIALQYGGEFMTDWKDGSYRAMISLAALSDAKRQRVNQFP